MIQNIFFSQDKMLSMDIGLKHMACGFTTDMKNFEIYTFDIYKENIQDVLCEMH